MKTLALIAVVIPIALCSCAPKTEQQQDQTPVSPVPIESSVVEKLIDLTAEDLTTINTQLFLYLHNQYMSQEPAVIASIEEFTTNGTSFEYKLVRDNMDLGGWHDDVVIEQPASQYSEGDSSREYSERSYSENSTGTYTNQVDTILITGNYQAYTANNGYVKLKTTGKVRFPNFAFVEDDQVSIRPDSMDIGDLVIRFSGDEFARETLYLKAKITKLTDDDLHDMSKDQLAYFRNEIFARHGHTFRTPKMVKYFNEQSWYKPNIDDATSLLNKFEKQNVEFIKSKEGK